jgi:hypothetical protein
MKKEATQKMQRAKKNATGNCWLATTVGRLLGRWRLVGVGTHWSTRAGGFAQG